MSFRIIIIIVENLDFVSLNIDRYIKINYNPLKKFKRKYKFNTLSWRLRVFQLIMAVILIQKSNIIHASFYWKEQFNNLHITNAPRNQRLSSHLYVYTYVYTFHTTPHERAARGSQARLRRKEEYTYSTQTHTPARHPCVRVRSLLAPQGRPPATWRHGAPPLSLARAVRRRRTGDGPRDTKKTDPFLPSSLSLSYSLLRRCYCCCWTERGE